MILAELNPNYPAGFVPVIWGGIVSIMIYALGHISGAHMNPAVSIAFAIIGRFSWVRLPGYITAQIAGALVASFMHSFLWPGDHSFGVTLLSAGVAQGFVMETILGFVLMFVVMGVATDSRAVGEMAGVAIGSTVALCAFVGGPMTKASMNPARSIGPAIVSGQYESLWLYIVAPIVSLALGALVYEKVRCFAPTSEDSHGCC